MEMKFRIENGTLVTEATPEADAVGFKEGAKFVVRRTSAGLKLIREDSAAMLDIAEEVMDRRRAVLKELAK